MAKNDAPIIVIKRVKKGGHGHHGGAWKIAYADFVTAMMAFFMLMWLMASTTPEQRAMISNYFNDPMATTGYSGNGAGNPALDGGDTIGGLHLHGLDSARRTGGHNHELMIDDALLTVSTTRDIGLALPDRSMIDMLEMQPELRAVQRLLLRRGSSTIGGIATALAAPPDDIAERLSWLADRGFVEELGTGIAGLGGEPRWKIVMKVRGQRIPARAAELLVDL